MKTLFTVSYHRTLTHSFVQSFDGWTTILLFLPLPSLPLCTPAPRYGRCSELDLFLTSYKPVKNIIQQLFRPLPNTFANGHQVKVYTYSSKCLQVFKEAAEEGSYLAVAFCGSWEIRPSLGHLCLVVC